MRPCWKAGTSISCAVVPVELRVRMTKPSYADGVKSFQWSEALADLGWNGHDDVDLAYTILDRHVSAESKSRTAIHWLGKDGSERRVSFDELSSESKRIANLLRRHGLQRGDRVAGVLPRTPEAIAIIIACLRAGAVYVPIFSGFSAEAVGYRLSHSSARFVFVGGAYRHLVGSDHAVKVISLDGGEPGDIDYANAVAAESESFEAIKVARTAPAFIIYTSGSTGRPKGCVIAANILAAMWPYVRYSLDLRPATDVFWPSGDPSWGYGLCCYLPALAAGASVISVESNASAAVCLEVIKKYGVTNFATNPTVLRSLMAQGESISTVGAQRARNLVLRRAVERRGCHVLPACLELHTDGSLRRHRIWIADRQPQCSRDGGEAGLDGIALTGPDDVDRRQRWRRSAARNGWIHRPTHKPTTVSIGCAIGTTTTQPRRCRRDNGPALATSPGATTTAIFGSKAGLTTSSRAPAIASAHSKSRAPCCGTRRSLRLPWSAYQTQRRGEAIKAFVVLRNSPADVEALSAELVQLAKSVCGRHQYPHVIEFVAQLPKTQTGKIQRFLLRSSSQPGIKS